MGIEQLAPLIWQRVDQGVEFAWPSSKKSWDNNIIKLTQILPNAPLDLKYSFEERACANRELRSYLSYHLTKHDTSKQIDLKAGLACWIVAKWGGIHRGSDKVVAWSTTLGSYSQSELEQFSNQMGNYRISSWSKLLAFADPESHAIYDARTSVALNCILSELGHHERFHMPESRNVKIGPTRTKLRQINSDKSLGYLEYIRLLKAISGVSGCDILDIEMKIFANAVAIAEAFPPKSAA